MDDKTRAIFLRVGVDPDALLFVPRRAIHDFMVKCDAWLDADNVLMFANVSASEAAGFLYYIGEERNSDVEGVGRGIRAWQLDEERAASVRRDVERYTAARADGKPEPELTDEQKKWAEVFR
jgi:hypothetical protein